MNRAGRLETCKETIKFTVLCCIIVVVVASSTINTAFIILRKNKYMQYGEKDQMTIAATPHVRGVVLKRYRIL